jgi:23S rRNA pseudouridine1911/1915/1917 synthase
MNLPILYEDANVVAVNKPAGLITHSDGRTKEETAEDWFKEKYPNVTVERPYVHRLDRDTSGILVFAKNEKAYDFLRKAFHDREVKKTYLAFVYGVPKEKKGVIDFDIGRSRKDFRLRSAQPKAKGRLREALTRYEVIGESGEYALFKVQPETGRTHQIRVHLKAINHPIISDKLYAPNHQSALGISRLGLHAYQIDLPLPSGARTTITAPMPNDLAPAFALFPDAC